MIGLCGGTTAMNQGRMFITLKPLEQRGPCQKQHFWESCHYLTADEVINRLRGKFAVVPGATLFCSRSRNSDWRPLWPGAVPVHAAEREPG